MTADAATGFNTRLWRRFVQIALPYWQSPERWRSRGLLALLIVLLLGQTQTPAIDGVVEVIGRKGVVDRVI